MGENIYYNSSNILNKFEFSEHKSENKRHHIHQEPTQMLLRNYISNFELTKKQQQKTKLTPTPNQS